MRVAAIILIIAALGTFGYWGATGAHFVTQYKVLETKTVEDEFGDTVEKQVMADKFQFGLMPGEYLVDGALPIGGGLGVIGVGLLLVDWRRRKKE